MSDASDYLMEDGERRPSDEKRINDMLDEVVARLTRALEPLAGGDGYISTTVIYNDTVYPLLGAEVATFGEVIELIVKRLRDTKFDEVDGLPERIVEDQ